MPFGLTNAPATFQAAMNNIFRPFLRKFVLVFFDDILIYSSTWTEHLNHLRLVFQILLDHHYFAMKTKCHFGLRYIEYLGHFISATEIQVDNSKIQAMTEWPVPQTLKSLRGFLGLTWFYRRFIKGYASITGPLTDLLKRDAFVWNPEAEAAFTQLKHTVSSAPVLSLPDFTLPFSIEADASGVGIGAVLSQQGHPIAFYSQKLSHRMQSASTYYRERYDITQAVNK